MNDKETNYINQKVIQIRPMTEDELVAEGWPVNNHHKCMVIELEDDTKIYPSRDPEGNGPGSLFGVLPDGTPIIIT